MSYLQGELTRAYTLAKECLALSTQERSFYKPEALYFLGAIVLEQGDPVQAGTLAEESLALSQEAGDKEGIALSLCLIGKVKARQGEHPAARTCYEQSIQIARERGLQWTLASGLEGLASVVVVQGELAWAVQLWATAEALREAIGAPLPPIERASYEQAVSVARTQLGEAAFTAAWQEGRAMSLKQVIDRAFTKGDEANKQERRTAQGTTPKRSSGKP
jgi:tetratricopeptide (TPR) repeat protein